MDINVLSIPLDHLRTRERERENKIIFLKGGKTGSEVDRHREIITVTVRDGQSHNERQTSKRRHGVPDSGD